MTNDIEVISQFPALTTEEIIDIEKGLRNKFGYPAIPKEYKAFLGKTNGCLFKVDDEDDFVALALNLPFAEFASVAGISGVWQSKYENLTGVHPEWPELFVSNQNSKENFNVLPDQMMSFAYEDESSGSFFAMSVAKEDFGKIYYYHDDYLYSIFGRKRMLESHGYCYYDRKIEGILKTHGINLAEVEYLRCKGHFDSEEIISNVEGLSADCLFELERAKFIPVAESLDDFTSKLYLESC